jgi:O-antigen ligase
MREPGRLLDDVGRQPSSAPGAVWVPATTPRARSAGWDLLLVCVAVYLAMAVGRVHQLFPMLEPLKPTRVAAALAVCLYVLQQSGPRRVELLRSAAMTCLLGLLLWAALSVPGALNQGGAFHFLTDSFVKTVLMSVVLAGSVRSVRDLERLIFVYFAVTVVYAAVVVSRFHLGGGDYDWRLNRLYDYDANDFATLVATAMPLGLYFVVGPCRVLLRVLAVVGLAVLGLGQVYSGSRGGFLACLAVAAFVLLRFTTVPARSRLAGLIVILAVVFATASDRYWTQMQRITNPDQDYNTTSESGRIKIWERGLGYMTEHPVFGVGVNNFPVAEGTISPLSRLQERGRGVRWNAAHNSFIQAGAELGMPGLLLFVGLIVSAFASLRRVARHSLRTGPSTIAGSRLAQSLMAALVGFVVGAFFLSEAYSDMLYSLVALAVALEKIAPAHEPQNRPLPPYIRI